MLSILSSVMGDCDAICRELRARLLTIWRREQPISPVAYELAKRLVEQNMGLFRRQLTREELLRFGGSCSGNELRRKGLCFICKGPWGLDHSCLSDTEEMIETEQGKISSDSQGDDSSLDESMGSFKDASEEHGSCGVVDSRPDLYSGVYGEQLVDPMGDTQDGVSLVMSQHERHMVEHESAEKDDVHSMHVEPFWESQLEVHIEPMMEEEEKTPLGPTIGGEQAATREVVFADIGHQEVLELDRTFLQVTSRPEEYGAFRQMTEDFLEMVVHPSLGLPTDELPIGAVAANRAIVFPGNNPL